MFDVAILGGTVFDGTGKKRYKGNVYIKDGRIACIAKDSEEYEKKHESKLTIDAGNLAVAPGFIDMHTHDDLFLLSDLFNSPKLTQGVTTVAVGNCGMGAALKQEHSTALYDYQTGVLGPMPGEAQTSFQGYVDHVCGLGPVVNVAPFIGHIPLRAAVAGFEGRPLSQKEMDSMGCIARQAMEQGAFGISTGLTYQPVFHSDVEELVFLGGIVQEFDGLFTFHMRGYGANLLDSLDEVICVAKRSKARVQVSHLRTNSTNRGAVAKAIERIVSALDDGIDIGFDNYPYTAGASILSQILPDWVVEGGIEKALLRLSDDGLMTKAVDQMNQRFEESGPDTIMVLGVNTKDSKKYEGSRLGTIAKDLDVTPGEALLRLYMAEKGRVSIASFVFAQEDVDLTLNHPLSIIISDGIHTEGKPHPRLYGTFPKFIEEYGIRGSLGLEEVIRKITLAPANRVGLVDRGVLKEGYWADVTIFDPGRIKDTASYNNPVSHAQGIQYVLVNGELVIDKGMVNAKARGTGSLLHRSTNE